MCVMEFGVGDNPVPLALDRSDEDIGDARVGILGCQVLCI
jgi:hypothetical protein